MKGRIVKIVGKSVIRHHLKVGSYGRVLSVDPKYKTVRVVGHGSYGGGKVLYELEQHVKACDLEYFDGRKVICYA